MGLPGLFACFGLFLAVSLSLCSEYYAKNVILKTKGDKLSELKSLTDHKGDVHSMHKLVYQDIKDPAIREEVRGCVHALGCSCYDNAFVGERGRETKTGRQ